MTHEITVKVTGFEKKETAKHFLYHVIESGSLNLDKNFAGKFFPEVKNGGIKYQIKND